MSILSKLTSWQRIAIGCVIFFVIVLISFLAFRQRSEQSILASEVINQKVLSKEKTAHIDVKNLSDSTVAIASGEGASINYYRSSDYQALQKDLKRAQKHVKDYPEDVNFKQELKDILQKIEHSKRDVQKLVEDFNKIPIDTERLRNAKQDIEAGNYQTARAKLDAESLNRDQNALLNQQHKLQTEEAELKKQLTNNANEFLLKAKLTAIDYSLEDRIAKTAQYFESALKSDRSPDIIFGYALFFQFNNQFADSERLYTEALTADRQLAKANPGVYLPKVARTLNNLGTLVSHDSQRRKEAEDLYTEALMLHRQLAKANPGNYLMEVATTLNQLGALVSDDSQRRKEAEALYTEALMLHRQLAKDNPGDYLWGVAITLDQLGDLVSDDSQRRKEAEALIAEANAIKLKLKQLH